MLQEPACELLPVPLSTHGHVAVLCIASGMSGVQSYMSGSGAQALVEVLWMLPQLGNNGGPDYMNSSNKSIVS